MLKMVGVSPDDLPKDSPNLRGATVILPAPAHPPVPTDPAADSRFLDPLILKYLDGRDWELVSPFNYQTDVFPVSRRPIKIPAGFLTDFASVPRLLWNVMPPTGMYGKAAVIHDYLYRTPQMATRAEADNVFKEAMQALGVGWWTRQVMYRGVRLFGWRAYKGGL